MAIAVPPPPPPPTVSSARSHIPRAVADNVLSGLGNSYGNQPERAVENDNTSFGDAGNTTSHAGSFPAESSQYPNSMMGSGARSDKAAPSSGAPDPAFPGSATSTSDARNYGENLRTTVGGEPTGSYGGRTSSNTDDSMFGGSSEIGQQRQQPAQDEQAGGITGTAQRVVNSAMDAVGMGKVS